MNGIANHRQHRRLWLAGAIGGKIKQGDVCDKTMGDPTNHEYSLHLWMADIHEWNATEILSPDTNLVEVFDSMSFGSRDLIYRPYQEDI